MKIVLANDHAGYTLKAAVKKWLKAKTAPLNVSVPDSIKAAPQRFYRLRVIGPVP